MYNLPAVRIICSPVPAEAANDLAKELAVNCVACGFNMLPQVDITQSTFEFKVLRFSAITKPALWKLFKRLNRKYKTKCLRISEDEWLQHNRTIAKSKGTIIGSGVRSYLARHGSNIRKYFVNADDFMHTEIEARQKLAGLEEVIPIITAGENWVEMPYINNELRWQHGGLSLYPLQNFDAIYRFLTKLYAKGYCMTDWNWNSFMFQDGKLYVCDFEYLYKHSSPKKYQLSPDLTGKGQENTMPNGTICTFKNTWQKLLGFSLEDYLTLPREALLKKRRRFLLTSHYPRFLYALVFNRFMATIKNSIKLKTDIHHGYLTIQQRF